MPGLSLKMLWTELVKTNNNYHQEPDIVRILMLKALYIEQYRSEKNQRCASQRNFFQREYAECKSRYLYSLHKINSIQQIYSCHLNSTAESECMKNYTEAVK